MESVCVVGAGIRLSDGSVCQRWRAGGMCARRTARDWRSAGGFTVIVLLCQRRCAQGECLSLSDACDIILWNPFNQSSCRVCWRWSWRYPPTALTPTDWRCWGDCGWLNLMWRRRAELWRRSESCTFSHKQLLVQVLMGVWLVLKLLSKLRHAAENNTSWFENVDLINGSSCGLLCGCESELLFS